jgi:penicillin-binding protein 1B
VVNYGTARSLNRLLPDSIPLAGKTGTTNDLRDSWFAGYGSDILAVAWIGRDDNGTASLSGASGALRIWSDIMQELKPAPLALASPDGVVWIWSDPVTGLATGEHCPDAIRVPYIKPYLPAANEACAAPAVQEDSASQEKSGIMGFIRGIFE